MGSGRFRRMVSWSRSHSTDLDPRDLRMIDLTTVERILFAALEKPAGLERAAFLDEVCGQDAQLRQHVERLLAAHPRAAGFLDVPAPKLVATADEGPIAEQPGMAIGPYKLMEQLGPR